MAEAKRLAKEDFVSLPEELAADGVDLCARTTQIKSVMARFAAEQKLPVTTFDSVVSDARVNLITEVAKPLARVRAQFPTLYNTAAEASKIGTTREERRVFGNFGIAFSRWHGCLISEAKTLALKSNETAPVIADAAFATCKGSEQAAVSIYDYIYRATPELEDRARSQRDDMITGARQSVIKAVIDARAKR